MSVKLHLLDLVGDRVRLKHYSLRTKQAYVDWIRYYILFHGKKHPAEMSKPEIESSLSDLEVNRNVSTSAQNQALSALLFLYKEVLGGGTGLDGERGTGQAAGTLAGRADTDRLRHSHRSEAFGPQGRGYE